MEYMETMYARRNMVVRGDFLVLNEHKNANRKSSLNSTILHIFTLNDWIDLLKYIVGENKMTKKRQNVEALERERERESYSFRRKR